MTCRPHVVDISGREHLEQWRPIPGFEGLYEASNLGRVLSVPRRGRRGRILKQRLMSDRDYAVVTMSRDGKYRDQAVHRMVLMAFIGLPPEGHECCHNNGDPTDNRIENLRWDTKNSNTIDQVKHGTHHHVRKTYCPQGHAYDSENTYLHPRGLRVCRICKRQQLIDHRSRRRKVS